MTRIRLFECIMPSSMLRPLYVPPSPSHGLGVADLMHVTTLNNYFAANRDLAKLNCVANIFNPDWQQNSVQFSCKTTYL